jgi:subtilase family serine protease
VYATIRNQGYGDALLPRGWRLAGANFAGTAYDSDHPELFRGSEERENIRMKRGEIREVRITTYPSYSAGTWELKVMVDSDKQIKEANENNNVKTVQLTVADAPPPSKPDLIITDLWLDPAEATVEGNFEVVAIIKNQGAAPATFPQHSFALAEDGRGDNNVENIYLRGIAEVTIQPGQSKEFRCDPTRLQVGTSTWVIKVDPTNKVYESNENNNTKSIVVTIR